MVKISLQGGAGRICGSGHTDPIQLFVSYAEACDHTREYLVGGDAFETADPQVGKVFTNRFRSSPQVT